MCMNSLFSILSMQGIASVLSVNAIFSVASVNSFFSIGKPASPVNSLLVKLAGSRLPRLAALLLQWGFANGNTCCKNAIVEHRIIQQ